MSTLDESKEKKESVPGPSELLELSDEKLEEVAGGQTNCIPTDPITSDVLPMPQLPPTKDLL